MFKNLVVGIDTDRESAENLSDELKTKMKMARNDRRSIIGRAKIT